MIKKYSIFILILVVLPISIVAQSFYVQTSKNKVFVGEQFQVSFTLKNSGGEFTPPSFENFQVYSGPNQYSNNINVNGNVMQTITISYVIAAYKEGKYTIAPATVNANGKTLKSNSIIIEVVTQKEAQTQNSTTSSGSKNKADENVFAKTIVSKSSVYKGEQVTVSHKIYSRSQLLDIQDVQLPDYNGFWSQQRTGQTTVNLTNEIINGVKYQVAEIQKVYLFPQRTGKLIIDPFQLKCLVRVRSNRPPRDIMEQFFGTGYEDIAIQLKAPPVSVNVLPLPTQNKAEDYTGAVGDFSCSVTLSKVKVKENEAINLKVTITGNGNIKLIEALKINTPEDFEVYEPKLNEKISTDGDVVRGSKIFDYVLIPRHEGEYKIEPASFSYFNPSSKKYVTIDSPEFTIQVEKGEQTANSVSNFSIADKEEVKELGNDIRYIKTDSVNFTSIDNYFFGSALFYILLLIPLFAFVVFFIVYRKRKKEMKDTATLKSRKANKIAKKRLSIAEKQIASENKDLFYSEILKALFGYISDKFDVPSGELNKERIAEELKKKQISELLINNLTALIDNCEYAKYAPAAVSSDLLTVYNSARELIEKIEDEC